MNALASSWLMFAALAASPPQESYPRADMLVEPAAMAKHEAAQRFVIVDARDRKAFETSRIPLARWVDVATWGKAFGDGKDAEGWSRRIGELGIARDARVAVYDDNLSRDAARIWWILRYWGVEDVRLLNGGWSAWQKAGLPVETGETKPPAAADFKAAGQRSRLATKGQVLKSLAAHGLQILDARTENEFCGIDKQENKRGGAIPGAKHLEWSNLLDKQTQRFKSPSELSQLFREANIDLGKPAATHCQTGGRASVLVFGMELMGAKDVRNYYRGWSEWGNADDTPIIAAAPQDRRPNIVFILADDLGSADLGCYGRKDIRTPAIDRLAAEGVRFTNAYSNGPECTPTRTAFLTGRYQHRVGGLECAIGSGNVGRYDDAARLRQTHDLGLPVSETSIARMLKEAGYATGITGKWHLGYEDKFSPSLHGFDYAFYEQGGGIDYFHHVEHGDTGLVTDVLRLNGKPIQRKGYFTDLATEEAIGFLRRQSGPFFLYVPYTAPHSPFQGPDDWRPEPLPLDSPLLDQGKAPPAVYRAMIERLDQGVGRILQTLAELKLAQNTVVIFMSDNGGTKSGSNGILRGNKGSTFEGGIRVPAIVRWPARIPKGLTSDQPCITMDFSRSIVRLAGAQPAEARPFDGIDILQRIEAGRPVEPRTLFWRKRRGDETWWGVRDGSLKYVRAGGKRTEEHLFDLAQDPAEQHELLASRPAEAARLKALLDDWEKEVQPVR